MMGPNYKNTSTINFSQGLSKRSYVEMSFASAAPICGAKEDADPGVDINSVLNIKNQCVCIYMCFFTFVII